MSDEAIILINQAREQARIDNFKRFLGKNFKIVFRLVLVLLVAGLVFIGFNSYQKSSQEKYSAILHQSLINQQTGDIAKAKANLKEIYDAKSAPNGVRSLASLRYAGLFFEEGNKVEAAKIYQEINECGSCDDYIRDLAGLLAVKVWVSEESELKQEDLITRIEKIENKATVLKYEIAEQKGFVEMERGNLEKSYQIFEMITKAPETSKSLKERAADEMLMVVEKGFVPQIDVKEETKESEAKEEVKDAEKSQAKE